jgi:hypothetical protein
MGEFRQMDQGLAGNTAVPSAFAAGFVLFNQHRLLAETRCGECGTQARSPSPYYDNVIQLHILILAI